MANAYSDGGPSKPGVDMSSREDALEILPDVLDWTMTGERWQTVGRMLDAMSSALAAGDDAALQAAVTELELISPLRMRKIGTASVVPPTAPIRDRVNHLIHSLGGVVPPDDEPPSRVRLRSSGPALEAATNNPPVVQQELVAHLFAPVDGPRADDAYGQLSDLWANCAHRLGAMRPIPGIPFAHALPDSTATLPAAPLIAGQEGVDTGFQAVLRREHDLLNLSAAFAPTWTDNDQTGWAELTRQWTELADEVGATLGQVLLYVGKVETADPTRPRNSSRLADAAAGALSWLGASRLDGGFTAVDGFAVWEVDACDDARAQRRFLILGQTDSDGELSAWAWSGGGPAMPPFARYLMHAAKIRYELRVRKHATPVAQLRGRMDEGVGELTSLIRSAAVGAPVSDAGPQKLAELRADQARVVLMAADLQDMRRTVQIAEDNMRAALGPGLAAAASNALGDDLALAASFAAQLSDDVHYLEIKGTTAAKIAEIADALPTPAQPTARPDVPTFGIVTALPEEFTAVRLLLDTPERRVVAHDRADYFVGTMPSLLPDHPHRVVLTLLGETGNDAAAESCANLARSFGSVDQIVMAGIAAGIPDPEHPAHHVRLGDIVVATWGIVDYDHVRDTPAGLELRQPFPSPSALLVRRAKMLEAMAMTGERPWERWLDDVVHAQSEFSRPPEDTDVIDALEEPGGGLSHPDRALSEHRPGLPKVHYGRIGSADRALRNAATRGALAARHQLRAVEMEGKGIGRASFAGGREWFVVRGISDYGNSQTNNLWRPYASLVAASYVRALLAECPPIAHHGGHIRAMGL